jgi:hypothetical protein
VIPLSGGVLLAAAVVASPALYLSLVEQTMPIDVALTRYFVVLGIAWVGLSFLADLMTPSPGAVRAEQDQAGEQENDPVG